MFIQKDTKNSIILCSPNKILLSEITTIKPFKRLLPVGFQTCYKYNVEPAINEIDILVDKLNPDKESYFKMDFSEVVYILKEIEKTLIFEPDYKWDIEAMISTMEYVSNNTKNINKQKIPFALLQQFFLSASEVQIFPSTRPQE